MNSTLATMNAYALNYARSINANVARLTAPELLAPDDFESDESNTDLVLQYVAFDAQDREVEFFSLECSDPDDALFNEIVASEAERDMIEFNLACNDSDRVIADTLALTHSFASQKETTMNATTNTQNTAALDYARTVDSSIARVSSESYECSYCSHKQAYTAFDANSIERFSFCLDCIAQDALLAEALTYARTIDSLAAHVSVSECSECSEDRFYTAFDANHTELFSFCLECIAQAKLEDSKSIFSDEASAFDCAQLDNYLNERQEEVVKISPVFFCQDCETNSARYAYYADNERFEYCTFCAYNY